MVNVKPSRVGSLKGLLDTYDFCDERGIAMYGGGQFELGVGRGHIQLLASLFHPDTPNDTSPSGFHAADPPPRPAHQPAAARRGDGLSVGLILMLAPRFGAEYVLRRCGARGGVRRSGERQH